MSHLGDFAPASSVVFNFNTASFSDGSPITLAGTPALSVYKNSTTESTTGITLTVDYDARTGMHHVVIDTSADGTFYAAGNDFDVVITTGTVGGTSVVGRVVGSFSLANRSALRPTVAGRTADIAATGEIGLDFDNIHDATGAHTLTNIRVPNVTLTDTVTAYTGNTPQTGDTFALANGASGFVAIKTDTGNLVTRITATLFSGITSLAQWLGLIAGKQVGDTTARTELRATGAGSGGFDETTDSVEAIRDRGDAAWITATGFAVAGDAMALTVAERAATADKLLGRSIAGGADGGRTVQQSLATLRNKFAFDVPGAGQFTVYDENDATANTALSWTGTYTASAGADPVITIDPT